MRQHISYAVLIAAIAAGLSTQVQGRASEAPTVEQQDNAFFSFLHGRGRGDRVFANLQSEQEVPAVSSVARGRFRAEIDDDRSSTNCRSKACRGRSPSHTSTSASRM